jgi:hypothetical protein
MNEWVCSIGGMVLTGENVNTWRTCQTVTTSTTNPTRNDVWWPRASAMRGHQIWHNPSKEFHVKHSMCLCFARPSNWLIHEVPLWSVMCSVTVSINSVNDKSENVWALLKDWWWHTNPRFVQRHLKASNININVFLLIDCKINLSSSSYTAVFNVHMIISAEKNDTLQHRVEFISVSWRYSTVSLFTHSISGILM